MREFQLSRYIKKWLPLIVTVCVILTAAAAMFLSSAQTYVASAVIQYKSSGAEEGKTPLGTDLDVNEIKSSAIVSKVIANLGLDKEEYSIDKLISKIRITEVIDEDEMARKEALLDDGEEYLYEPTIFIVSFEADDREGEDFARKVLDEVLDLYFADYSEKYVNSGLTVNSLSEIYSGNYDYIEMMEIIDSNVSKTLETMNQRGLKDFTFRSAATGMSYMDLVDEFNFLRSVRTSGLFSKIFEYQITKDKTLLLSKYGQRIRNNEIANQSEEKMVSDVVVLIDAYVEKMRASGNTDITYEYILDEVYNKDYLDMEGAVVGRGDQTVTYDRLIFNWRDHNEKKEYNMIDSAYCQYIMDVFSQPQTFSGAEYDTAVSSVGHEIEALIGELNGLYKIVEETNAEYNEYLGAKNISILSTVSVSPSMNVGLYTAIAAVFLLVVCCCGAILVGRLEDIVQYTFYTDQMTGLNNRLSFDHYLKNMEKKLLADQTVCVSIIITNQVEINQKFGHEFGNQLIRVFSGTLREVFPKEGVFPVYNGKAQFFVIAEGITWERADDILKHFALIISKQESLRKCDVCYEIGIAEAKKDSAYRIRTLISKAVASQKEYTEEK